MTAVVDDENDADDVGRENEAETAGTAGINMGTENWGCCCKSELGRDCERASEVGPR